MDFCSYWFINSSNRHFITFVILYDVFKNIGGTKKPFTILVVLSTDPENAIKSLVRRNFKHFWSIFTKVSTFYSSPICPIERCVILYDGFKTIYSTYKPFARLVVLYTNPDMAVKSHARENFELFWVYFHKNKCLLDCCVIPRRS